MVDLRATNQKLWDRGGRIIQTLCGLDREHAMGFAEARRWTRQSCHCHAAKECFNCPAGAIKELTRSSSETFFRCMTMATLTCPSGALQQIHGVFAIEAA